MNIRNLKSIMNTMVVIIGVDKLITKLDDEHKQIFKDIISVTLIPVA